MQASEGGAPVNEDPIAANPASEKELLTGGNDYNCPNIQGFYASTNAGTTWNTTCMANLSGYFGAGRRALIVQSRSRTPAMVTRPGRPHR